ncbi:Uncharacterized protein FSCOSCO3_A029364 [Scomber scombrus]|uniref:Uncharacterized protein n=1 Tax=Scomber scombrus TaxID=13677 RepID=A0AAV1NZ35_SCOSC
MIIYQFALEIPLFCIGVTLWILCCHYAKKNCEAEDSPLTPSYNPSVYVIPIYEEEQEEEEEYIHEAYVQPPYRDPPMYVSRNVSPPPPYRLEPPSYQEVQILDPPPLYAAPPPYPPSLPGSGQP